MKTSQKGFARCGIMDLPVLFGACAPGDRLFGVGRGVISAPGAVVCAGAEPQPYTVARPVAASTCLNFVPAIALVLPCPVVAFCSCRGRLLGHG